MRKLLAAVLVAFMLMFVVPASPVEADTPGCVTRNEYRQAHRGDTKRRVHRIFDTAGRRQTIASAGQFKTEIRTYRTCSQFSVVSIAWDKNGNRPWRLAAKSAVWVR